MGSKTLNEILADAKAASGEASTSLPTLRDSGDFVSFEVLQVLRENRYKDPDRMQTNLIIQVASGRAAGEDISPGKYKLYMGSATLDRIAKTYNFKLGDKVALVLQREISTGKGNAMKDYSVEIVDARGRDVKRNLALQLERQEDPGQNKLELAATPATPAAPAAPSDPKDSIPF
jgi:hypothetical protein